MAPRLEGTARPMRRKQTETFTVTRTNADDNVAAGWRATFYLATALVIALGSFAAGIVAEREVFSTTSAGIVGDGLPEDNAKIDTIRHLLETSYYYRPTDPDAAATWVAGVESGAIDGMLAGADDYTTYLEPVEQAPVAEMMSGEYEGIGVWVDFPDNAIRIVAPMAGSPAEAAGIRAGDVIVAIDGVPVAGEEVTAAMDRVRGPAGTTVTLTLERVGADAPLVIGVTRAKITTPSVIYEPLDGGKIAYIVVTVFGDKTTDQLDAALQQAQAAGATAIVLDLRNNGGGWVQSAQEMIGRFISPERGPALYEDFEAGDSPLESLPILAGTVQMYDTPMVVLVNGGTASAAEIVAGALHDYGRATIVGETSFGKGSVQRVHDFEDGSSFRMTVANWLTPNQVAIQGVGITPDIVVATGDDLAADPQFDRAVAEAGALAGLPATPVASPVTAATPVA
jgi:carboxyl-terminal processing protease